MLYVAKYVPTYLPMVRGKKYITYTSLSWLGVLSPQSAIVYIDTIYYLLLIMSQKRELKADELQCYH
jgi:hypothetical protein